MTDDRQIQTEDERIAAFAADHAQRRAAYEARRRAYRIEHPDVGRDEIARREDAE